MKGLSKSFFFVPNERKAVQPGELLVAEPFMKDKWFGRSVIEIIDNDDITGTTGIVLNNRLTATLSEVFSDITAKDVPLFCGGPVGHDRLFFIHTLGDTIIPEAKEISPGLWIGGRFASAVDYVNSGYPTESSIRFFVGYSGWSAGQLASELRDNTWAVPERDYNAHSLLTDSGDKFWHKIVKEMGEKYRPWLLLPQDSRAN